MRTSNDLVSTAYAYLGGRATFGELYALAAELDPALFSSDPEAFPARLGGLVMHLKALQDDGIVSPDQAREEIAELLKAEALVHLDEAGSRR